jgi:hypothetical protein
MVSKKTTFKGGFFLFFAYGGTKKKGLNKERLRRALSIASQRVLLLAACGELFPQIGFNLFCIKNYCFPAVLI